MQFDRLTGRWRHAPSPPSFRSIVPKRAAAAAISPVVPLLVPLLSLLLAGCRPGIYSPDLERGKEALREGEPEVAKAAFASAVEASKNDPAMMEQVAIAYVEARKGREAVDWTTRAIRKKPDARQLEILGAIDLMGVDVEKGCEAVEPAVDRFMDDGAFLNNYAYLCLVEKDADLDRAIRLLDRAVRLARGRSYVVDSLGWAYFRRYKREGDPADLRRAATELEKAVVLSPDPEVRRHLIEAYQSMDAPAVANLSLSNRWMVRDALGMALLAKRPRTRERLEEALKQLELAVRGRPNDAPARLHLGLAYRAAGRREEADVEMDKAFSLDPNLRGTVDLDTGGDMEERGGSDRSPSNESPRSPGFEERPETDLEEAPASQKAALPRERKVLASGERLFPPPRASGDR